MIARLAGTLVEKGAAGSIVDVGGVGYAVAHSLFTFEDLPAVGTRVELHTHLHVREDALLLFGFSTPDERRLFEQLLSVSGVGPKVALAVLSGLSPVSFARAVADENLGALTRIAGVGRKTAERIVIELRDKIPPELAGAVSAAAEGGAGGRGAAAGGRGAAAGRAGEGKAGAALPGRLFDDAVEALVALGLTRPAAMDQVRRALDQGPASHVEELVRRALSAAGPRAGGRPRGGA
jgi:Holliday junction DNA helicase RuvA